MNSERLTCNRVRKYVAADCHAPALDGLWRRVCVVAATLLLRKCRFYPDRGDALASEASLCPIAGRQAGSD